MASEHQSQEDETIKIDQIERFRNFNDLKESALFRQFLKIFFKKRRNIFPKDMDDPSEEMIFDYFVSHPSIWNEAEECWRKDVRVEAKNLEVIQSAANISNHIRRLIARPIQKGKLGIAHGEDRGAI